MARVLIPLPDLDFDVTEVAVPWRMLTRAGHEVVFATEEGGVAQADPLLLTGVLFGKLGAEPEACQFYHEMEDCSSFQDPLRWEDLEMREFDALLLAGGHAPGMRQYLASELLQERVASFCALERPLGAICHGVLVLARTRDPTTGRSVLASRRTTCLPRYMEGMAYGLTFWKLGRYYRTYPAYVETEVRAVLDDASVQFEKGPITIGPRGTAADDTAAFVVEDGLYVSARWPGDAYLFTKRLMSRLGAP
ncbi:MAG: thiamine biosynthesis protein ThiJ [bacterium]|nr:thiamine biosynthesis protein ThiJ [bacterium]MCP5066932.1 thiamine biosynthesis protein ThiJ [bacterium]